MGGQKLLLAIIGFLALLQTFESKTVLHGRRIRSYDPCKQGEKRENACVVKKCSGGRISIELLCTCPKSVGFKCACTDHHGVSHPIGQKFIYQYNKFGGESLYCGCDAKTGGQNSGYCKSGCVDNSGKRHAEGESYEFEGNNGKYNCQCKNGKASCSKGFILPDNPDRPDPVLPPMPPGFPQLPPRPFRR